MRILVFVLLILAAGCTEKKDDSKKQLAALALFSQIARSSSTSTSTASACTSSFTCATSPSFSTLATAGTTTSCALSGCHSTSSQGSGLDILDYNSAKAFTNSGNPCSSRLYTAITTGAMAGNANSKIREAVFCWIAGGTKP